MESYFLCAFALLQKIHHNDFWSQHFLIAGLKFTPVYKSAKNTVFVVGLPRKAAPAGRGMGHVIDFWNSRAISFVAKA